MPITLLSGPINSGKTSWVLDALASNNVDRARVIVPNGTIAEEWRRRFLAQRVAEHGAPALVGDLCLSVARFVRSLAAPHLLLNEHQQTLLVWRILNRLDLRYFQRGRISLGLAREAAQTISLLKQQLVTPERLRTMLATRGTLKEFDFLNLLTHYEVERAALGACDAGDVWLQAIARLQRGELGRFSALAFIACDEFFPWLPGERALITALKQALPAAEIVITTPTADHHRQLFSPLAATTLAELTALADRHIALPAVSLPSPTISFLATTSPGAEARLILEQACGQPGDQLVTATVCCRAGSTLPSLVRNEIALHDRDMLLPRTFSPLDAPLSHQLLDEVFVTRLPRRENLVTFAHEAADVLRSTVPTHSSQQLIDPATRAAASRRAGATTVLDQTLSQLASDGTFLRIGELSRGDFLELVRTTLAQADATDRDAGTPFLEFSFFETGRSSAVERLFLPTMIEGTFPRVSVERMFFTDRVEWGPEPNRILDATFPTAEVLLAHESFLFHTWLAKARREVIFTYPLVDDAGNETIPSSFMDEMGAPLFLQAAIPAPRAARDPLFLTTLSERLTIEAERQSGHADHPAFHGRISAPAARALIRRRFTTEPLSASRLEVYAECPLRFFFERVLHLKPDEEVTREIVPKDRGTIIHAILERLWRDHLATFVAACHDAQAEAGLADIVDRLVAEVFQAHAEIVGRAAKALIPFERHAVRTVVAEVIRHELEEHRRLPEPLTPYALEWNFGTTPATLLMLPVADDVPAKISGRVDRIDVSADRRTFLIIDYKTGRNVDSVRHAIAAGRHFQLPLYIEAVRRLALPAAQAAGGFLFAVTAGEKRHGIVREEFRDIHFSLAPRSRTAVAHEAWNTLMDGALQRAAAVVATIRAGIFTSGESEPCAHCPFPDACRKVGNRGRRS